MAGGGTALYPYMAGRNYPVSDVHDTSTMAKFPYAGTITFKWGEAQSGSPNDFVITANGQWGGLGASHFPIVRIVASVPGSPTVYGSEAAMQAALGTHNYGTRYTSDDAGSDGDYAQVGSEYWYCFKNTGYPALWIPVRTRTSAGTATINGESCDVYTCDVDVVDVPKLAGESMDADEIFDLCWAYNGRHVTGTNASNNWDASFKLTPEGYQLQDRLTKRVEQNARTAGQKSIKKDEFITRSQLRPGTNVTFEYLNDVGIGSEGYVGGPDEGFDILIHADAQGGSVTVGTNVVSGVNLGSGVAISWGSESTVVSISKVLISDEPDWIYDALLARTGINPGTTWDIESIPVHAQYVESPTGTVNVSLRTLHTGLYASHDNGTIVTQKNAAPNGTIGHIQFLDTPDIDWTITETDIDGHRGYRPGIVISGAVNFPTAYSWWLAVNNEVTGVEVSIGQTVGLFSSDGTVTISRNVRDVDISRPLQMTERDENGIESKIGPADTLEIIMDNEGLDETLYTEQGILKLENDGSGRREMRVFTKAASAPVSPSFIYKWYRAGDMDDITYGNQKGDWTDFRICNKAECHREQITTPWGPLKDDLSLAFPNAVFQMQKPTWEGPSGAFSKVAGYTSQAAELRHDPPFLAGAMQVNQDGYYHTDITQHCYLVKGVPIEMANANPFDYYSIWNLYLMVYRANLGTWQIAHHYDTEVVHHQKETGSELFWNALESGRRVHLQGSTDIWLNDGDKICFLRSGTCRVPGLGPYAYDNQAWYNVLTYQAFNIHWLHDDAAFAKDDTHVSGDPEFNSIAGQWPNIDFFWVQKFV